MHRCCAFPFALAWLFLFASAVKAASASVVGLPQKRQQPINWRPQPYQHESVSRPTSTSSLASLPSRNSRSASFQQCLPAEISNLPPIFYANFGRSLLSHKSFENVNPNHTPILILSITLTLTLTLTQILNPKPYTTIITRVLFSSAYTLFNVIS